MDVIRIDSLEVACIVGVRPHERRRKQMILLDLTLGLDLSRAGRSGRITHTCDYSRVTDELSALLQFREYQLIEGAVTEASAMLFGLHPGIEEVSIRIEKPAALGGRARASVGIERRRADFPREHGTIAGTECDVLLETHEAGLYLFAIDAQRSLDLAAGSGTRRLEWLTAGELVRGRSPLCEGEPLLTNGSAEHVTNPGRERAILFVCTTPKLGGALRSARRPSVNR
jgi:dihydroneopterin aldolase